MSDPLKHKLSDAIPKPTDEKAHTHGGKPTETHDVTAENVREQQEAQEAKAAEGSIRDHMVDIGRGHQQAGRQGQ